MVVNMIMAGMSGSSVADAAATGTILGVSRALIPFLIALLVALVILIVYPPLTLWLPKMLMG